jgi:hypothetical protein
MSRRLARGTRIDPVQLGYVIERTDKLELDRLAEASGVSASVFIELMLKHLPLTEHGVPEWAPSLKSDEELPIEPA